MHKAQQSRYVFHDPIAGLDQIGRTPPMLGMRAAVHRVARVAELGGYIRASLIRVEYIQLCRAIAVGFVVMGFIGYFVKLIHIPM